jgi:uncharacterized repeat protein (TIGR01451 family)
MMSYKRHNKSNLLTIFSNYRNLPNYKSLSSLFFLILIILAGPFISSPAVFADGYPPYWDNSNGAVHYPPVNWPDEGDWISYTHEMQDIKDARTADPSNGGTAPQNYVNISSSCTDQSLPSISWAYDDTSPYWAPEPTFFFRWRVEQIPNTYATGPNPGTFSPVDPWKCAQWTVLMDVNGDGFYDFAVNIDGCSGSPSEDIDVIKSIYNTTKSQSVDYENNSGVYLLAHNPTAFVDASTNRILNFRNSLSPTTDWPNGSAETVWDYGTTRSTNITYYSPSVCNEYVIDYQIPLAMLDASSVGGQAITPDTPFCMTFVTANSNVNPLQKDVGFDTTFLGDINNCMPCGDLITSSGGASIPQPTVDWITATGCGTTTLTAQVRDAIDSNCQSTVMSVDFYYCYDQNADGTDDDCTWTSIIGGGGTVDPDNPGKWTLSWNTTTLNAGQYLIGVRAQDDDGNITWSYLASSTPPNYANPEPVPGVVYDIFNNTCGENATLTKTVNPAYTSAGSNVTFTITVTNNTSSAFNLTSITDALPSGFSYQSSPAEGGTLNGSIASRPSDGATGNVTWTFNPGTSIAASSGSGTLTFTAQVSSIAGTYTNSVSAVTDDPDWGSLTSNAIDIGVGDPQLTIAKSPSAYQAVPGDTITYTIIYSNDSPVNTTDVVITDTLPAGLNFVAAGNGGTYDSLTRTITWNLGSLASGEGPYTVTYQVTVDQGASVRTENTATIESTETSPATATTAIHVPSPLLISKTADKVLVDPLGAAPDNQVTYTITYQNTGSSNLTGATITDTTIPGFTYTSCTGGCSTSEPSGDGYGDDDGTCETGEPCTVTWTLASPLIPGASGSVTLTLTVTNPYTETSNPAINTAVINTNEAGPFEDGAPVLIRDYDCGGTKDRYYFHDLDASALPEPWTGTYPGTPLPTTQARDYANLIAPVSPIATDITVNIIDGSEYELAQFYMDPPLDRPSGFSIAGTVDMQAYMSKGSGGKVNIICYMYDYNPDTGEAIQIGTLAADSGAGNRDHYLLTFTITPSGIIQEGNILMWRFTAQRTSSYTGQVSFHYDSSQTSGSQAGLSYGDVCFAPLSITMDKSVDKLEADPGDTLAYTMTFSNSGEQAVTGATITDTLPNGVTYGNATLNGSAVTPVGGTCTAGTPCIFDIRTSDNPTPWPPSPAGSGGTLSGGQTGTLVINVTINNPIDGITTLTNIARISTADTDPEDDAATTDINHSLTPYVFLQKSADKTLLNPGDTVTYTIKVVNVGDATATNIVLTDDLSPMIETWFTYVNGSASDGGTYDSGTETITWPTIASIAPGATVTRTFHMLVASSGVDPGVNYKDNFASATDGTTSTNSNTVTVAVTTNANISLTKSVSSPAYTASIGTGDGSTTIFNTTLTNTPVQAGSVEVFVAGSQVGVGSGSGTIIGGGLTASTIDYTTGALHLEFLTAPTTGAAITASYRQELAPGATVQYSMTVTSNGGSTATGVAIYDPIPSGTSYVAGSLLYDDTVQTDESGVDNAYFDAVNNRVVFTPGDMTVSPDTSHTLKFSVLLDSTFADGSTTITNTGTALATNTASKSDSAAVVVTTVPGLSLSKAAPTLVPYPLATLNGNHIATTTLTLNNPPGSRYFTVGDHIYINGNLRIVTSIISATQVGIDSAITAGSGTQVIPVIKYSLYYANTGTTSTPNAKVKDILTANLNYLAATPTPTTAPAYNTNGILEWNLGTLSPGASGSIIVYTRPTITGSYSNTATMSASTVSEFASNTVITTVGALELDKYTTTPSVVNNPVGGADYATYVIRVRNPFPTTTALGVQVTDYLPQGFSYAATTSIVITGTGSRSATINPTVGDTEPTWGTWILGANSTLTITFTALLASTVGAGTYQNGVTAISSNLNVLPFDELITTAEDVTVTIPSDLKVTKAVQSLSSPCNPGSCQVVYLVTVTNVGTANESSITVSDTLPASLTYVTSSSANGSYDPVAKIWTLASALTPNSSATLSITATVNTFTSTIQNCASLLGSTPADTNTGNDTGCADIIPTLVTLSGFKAYEENGRVVIEWTTSSENDTAGFYLFRLDESTGEYIRINDQLLPGLLTSPQGGIYSLVDLGSSPYNSYTYVLMEVEGKGKENTYGPFTVQPGGGNAIETQHSIHGFSTQMPGSCTTGTCSARQKTVSSIRKSFDSNGTATFTNRDNGKVLQNSTGNYSSYTRKAHTSAGKAIRLEALVKARDAARQWKETRTGTMAKIPVSENGMYYLDSSNISSLLGISSEDAMRMIKKNRISLSNRGRDVAYLPAEGNAGIFFYGEGIDSIYTDENIYWLKEGSGLQIHGTESHVKGRVSRSRGGLGRITGPVPVDSSTFTETLYLEEDRSAVPAITHNPHADYWFWDYIVSGYNTLDTKTFSFDAHGIADTQDGATLTVYLQGFTETAANPDHHVVIKLNGTLIGSSL